MRMSAVAASSSPPPKAWPVSAATSGTRRRARASKARWPSRVQSRHISSGGRSLQAAMSPPAQNALPSPERMAARTSRASSIASAARASATIIARSSALSLSGRFSVSRATGPSKVEANAIVAHRATSVPRGEGDGNSRPNGSGMKQRRVHRLQRVGDEQAGISPVRECRAARSTPGAISVTVTPVRRQPHDAALGDIE